MTNKTPRQSDIGKIILENNFVRYRILKFLYLVSQENKKTSLDGVASNLNLLKEKVKVNLGFLKGEGLVEYIENINGEPITAWGPKGGVTITSKGMKLLEEIELQKSEKDTQIRKWILDNASWIVPSIFKIIEKLNSG